MEQKDGERLQQVSSGGWDVAEAASWQSGGDEVDADDVLLPEIELWDISESHPRVRIVSPRLAQQNLGATHYMEINTSCEYKLEKIKLPFNLLDLINSFGLSLLLN